MNEFDFLGIASKIPSQAFKQTETDFAEVLPPRSEAQAKALAEQDSNQENAPGLRLLSGKETRSQRSAFEFSPTGETFSRFGTICRREGFTMSEVLGMLMARFVDEHEDEVSERVRQAA